MTGAAEGGCGFVPADHPAMTAAGGDAGWLYMRAVAWTNTHGTGGTFPASILDHLSDRRKPEDLAIRLTAFGLWHIPGHNCPYCEQPEDGHFMIHTAEEGLPRSPLDPKPGSRRSSRPPETAGENSATVTPIGQRGTSRRKRSGPGTEGRAAMSAGGSYGAHRRWCVGAGKTRPECPVCRGSGNQAEWGIALPDGADPKEPYLTSENDDLNGVSPRARGLINQSITTPTPDNREGTPSGRPHRQPAAPRPSDPEVNAQRSQAMRERLTCVAAEALEQRTASPATPEMAWTAVQVIIGRAPKRILHLENYVRRSIEREADVWTGLLYSDVAGKSLETVLADTRDELPDAASQPGSSAAGTTRHVYELDARTGTCKHCEWPESNRSRHLEAA